MNLYMIRDKGTDRWYKKGYGGGTWVPQELASIWTTPNGPGGAKANIDRYNKRAAKSRLTCATWKPHEPEVVILVAEAEITSRPSRVIIVKADDWEGVYFDGKLIEEGHNLRLEDVLARLDIVSETVWANEVWLNNLGRLPENLEEVQRD